MGRRGNRGRGRWCTRVMGSHNMYDRMGVRHHSRGEARPTAVLPSLGRACYERCYERGGVGEEVVWRLGGRKLGVVERWRGVRKGGHVATGNSTSIGPLAALNISASHTRVFSVTYKCFLLSIILHYTHPLCSNSSPV